MSLREAEGDMAISSLVWQNRNEILHFVQNDRWAYRDTPVLDCPIKSDNDN